jgi:hypothetical protein
LEWAYILFSRRGAEPLKDVPKDRYSEGMTLSGAVVASGPGLRYCVLRVLERDGLEGG